MEETVTEVAGDVATDLPESTEPESTEPELTKPGSTAPESPKPESMKEALGDEGELMESIESELSAEPIPTRATPLALEELDPDADADIGGLTALGLLADIEVEVRVEFGRRRLPLRELLALSRGSLIELDREPDQHVTVLANGTEIAYGDIVLVGEQLGVHIVGLAGSAGKRAQATAEAAGLADTDTPAGSPGGASDAV
jgi:flagellar motor switch protein FliN